jgi:hypothetical protein
MQSHLWITEGTATPDRTSASRMYSTMVPTGQPLLSSHLSLDLPHLRLIQVNAGCNQLCDASSLGGVTMYKVNLLVASTMFALGFAVTNASAAPQCPPGYKLECKPQTEQQKQKAPPPCRCVALPSGSTSGGGKAEIKRKNVPQVQPNKRPGPND